MKKIFMLIASAALIACGGSAPKGEANAAAEEAAPVQEVVNEVKMLSRQKLLRW